MVLYLVKGFLDVAATSLADAQALYTALLDPSTATNAATIDRVTAKLETLVQSDTGEPLTISSIDDAVGTISSWVTDASATLAVGLGDPGPRTADTYASTLSFSISGSTRLGTLALNTVALENALVAATGPRQPPKRSAVEMVLHIRKTVSGVTETVGLIPVTVCAGVLSSTPADNASVSYVSTVAARAGYVINLSGVSSLTGGGATTLDGQAAGSATFPVGCIVLTSDSSIARFWKLIGTYIAADDLSAGKIKPDNSDATLNPCHWQLI